jgi:signal transduction histidine kinase/CheY-like chemotaxis protein
LENLFSCHNDLDREKFKQFIADTAKGTPQLFEWLSHHKNGLQFWVEISLKLATISGKERIIAVIRDITDRKKAEQALLASERKWRVVFERSPVGFVILDNDTIIKDCNQCFADIFEVNKEKYLHLNLVENLTNSELRQNLINTRLVDTPLTFEGPYTSIFSNKHLYLRITTEKIADDLIIAILIDMTEKREAELAHERLQAQLYQAQKMESVALLAGGIAHDFNNMLGVIMGHTEIAREQVDSSSAIHTDLEEIYKAAERSAKLTRQLLAFARRQSIDPKIVNLNEVIESMLAMMRRLIGENIRLEWHPATDLWPVKVDPAQVDQIVANLCINARDAIGGVGNIVVETSNHLFDEEFCKEHPQFIAGEFIAISINDNGSGMDEDTLGHIFEPFFTTKSIGSGTGLGLASVYGAVCQNSGFINVVTKQGAGTTFHIFLPKYVESATENDKKEKPCKAAAGNETILVVEDEPSLLEMIATTLEILGYHVLAAHSPIEAHKIAEAFGPAIDLLITDVIMPEMNGQELTDRVLRVKPQIKSLYMSGYTENIVAREGILGHGNNFIQKPFTQKELAEAIRFVLDKK